MSTSSPVPERRGANEKEAPEIVIDTNVVLDWLLFDDPWGCVVGRSIAEGRLQWVATDAMIDELTTVLSRPGLERWSMRIGTTLDGVRLHCQRVRAPTLSLLPALRCSDPDDQKFIDLAMSRATPWLLSRDKALLKLAAKARTWGVVVQRPADWVQHAQA